LLDLLLNALAHDLMPASQPLKPAAQARDR
jgi:hypothetical protein